MSSVPHANPTPFDDIPADPKAEAEKIYFEGSPLIRGELGKVLLFGLLGAALIAAPIIYYVVNQTWPTWWITLALVLAGLIIWVIPVLIAKSIRYRVSSYRIDFERGILGKSIDTMELWHVDDIKFHQSLLARILGVGTITVMSDDQTTPSLPLRGVPNARAVFEALKQRVITIK